MFWDSKDVQIQPRRNFDMPEVGDTLLVAYSKFYLYKEPGEWSNEQGIRVALFNISSLKHTSATQMLRGVPSRDSLVQVLDHFIASQTPEDFERLKARGFMRGSPEKKLEKRWKWLSSSLCARYNFDHLGGQQWLEKKKNFGRYAVGRLWGPLLAVQKASSEAQVNNSKSASQPHES
eukprot:scaffold20311_cov42-Prasinocladus_malaysianus.AAC.1